MLIFEMAIMFFSYCKARTLQFSTNIEESQDRISKYVKFFNDFLYNLSHCTKLDFDFVSQENTSYTQILFKTKNNKPIIEVYVSDDVKKKKKLSIYSTEEFKIYYKTLWDANVTDKILDGLSKALIMQNLTAEVLNNNANISLSEFDQENNGVIEKNCSFMIIPNNRKYTIMISFNSKGKLSNFQFNKDDKNYQFNNVVFS